jgi:hypothetical protein
MSRRAYTILVVVICAFLALLAILVGVYVYFITHLRVIYPYHAGQPDVR